VSISDLKKASDKALIQAARKGDQKAFAALVRRYEETVFRFSFKVCRDRVKAEETLQDTFINVFRKLDSFDAKSKFSTWLYTIVSNNCLMKRRRRKIHALEESLEIFDDPPDGTSPNRQWATPWEKTPDEVLLHKELQTVLDGAIVKLPVDYRLVFVLRDVEGRSTQETASILKITEEATKSRLRRARAFLRDQLHPYLAAQGTSL
jgi:RNA polymerase sigma-70 factor (ECF subfamily)